VLAAARAALDEWAAVARFAVIEPMRGENIELVLLRLASLPGSFQVYICMYIYIYIYVCMFIYIYRYVCMYI